MINSDENVGTLLNSSPDFSNDNTNCKQSNFYKVTDICIQFLQEFEMIIK